MGDIKQKYGAFADKYSFLPFDFMDSEFEISLIEHEDFLLREIVQRIVDRVEHFSVIFESILQPDTGSLKSLSEAAFFSENEKKEIYDIYKRMVIILRGSLIVSLSRDEGSEAEFIRDSSIEWKEIKGEVIKYIIKLKSSWQNEKISQEKLGYMG